jgi:hypothetical protein
VLLAPAAGWAATRLAGGLAGPVRAPAPESMTPGA